MSSPILDAAKSKRTALQNDLELITVEPTTEARSLTDDETAAFEATVESIKKLDGQIEMLSAEEARKATAAAAAVEIAAEAPVAAPVVIRSEPMTYTEHSGSSYLMDLAAIQVPQAGMNAEAARSRMARHGQEVEVEARTNPRLAKNLAAAKREARATNTFDTTGGDMVPPLYLIDSWVPAFRPGRIIADRVRTMDLPAGTDSVNLPKVATGTTAYAQGAATSGTNASLTSTDLTTATVTAPVTTYYGQLEASLQLLEQSPVSGGMDQVIFQDLQAAYDQALDAALLSGTGTSGQHKGVLTYAATVGATTGSGSWTRTGATTFLNAGGVFNTLVSAVNQVETNRFAAPTAVWVHPRRANSFGIQLDTSATAGRPLFVKAGNNPFNALGNAADGSVPQGYAGELYGLPVIKDASIPTNWLTASTTPVTTGGTQDVMCVVKEDDIFLWEGPTRLRALPEVSSGTLGVRFQLFAYSAFMPDRAPTSIQLITGAALATANLGF